MYPDRIFLAVGAGEAMNEVPLGYEWPSLKERHARYEEAIKLIKGSVDERLRHLQRKVLQSYECEPLHEAR